MDKNIERSFKGKTENFENKEEQRKEQKHLKAYLRGDTSYTFGFKDDPVFGRVPAWHDVIQ